LHWADKQKPLREVAGGLGMFPEPVRSPSLVPEEIDAEAPVPAEIAEVIEDTDATVLIERFTIEEHFLRVEYVPARLPERRGKRRESEFAG
jgi:hypothetical protein